VGILLILKGLNKMRIGLFSDSHLANHKAMVDPNFVSSLPGVNSRGQEGLNVLDKVLTKFSKTNLDISIFCGDFWDNGAKLHPGLLFGVISVFAEHIPLVPPIYMLPGQHDYVDRKGECHGLLPLEIQRVEDFNPQIKIPRILGCKYSYNLEEQKELLSQMKPQPRATNILVGHFLVAELMEEAKLPVIGNHIRLEDIPEGFDLYAFGDMHAHVWLEDIRVVSVGTCCPHSFSDAELIPSCSIFNTDSGKLERLQIEDAPFFSIKEKWSTSITPKKNCYLRIVCKDDKERDKIFNDIGNKGFPPYRLEFNIQPTEKEGTNTRTEILITTSPSKVIEEYLGFRGVKDQELYNFGMKCLGGDHENF
jgi:hypothetical protein